MFEFDFRSSGSDLWEAVTHLVEPGSEEPRDLLDQGVGAEEGVVLLGEALHLLLVLVELLEVVGGHELDALGLGLVAVLLVAEQAHGELLAGHVLQPGQGTVVLHVN